MKIGRWNDGVPTVGGHRVEFWKLLERNGHKVILGLRPNLNVAEPDQPNDPRVYIEWDYETGHVFGGFMGGRAGELRLVDQNERKVYVTTATYLGAAGVPYTIYQHIYHTREQAAEAIRTGVTGPNNRLLGWSFNEYVYSAEEGK